MLLYAVSYLFVSVLWLLLFARGGGGPRLSTLFIAFGAGFVAGPPAGYISHAVEASVLAPSLTESFHLRNLLLYFFIVGPIEEGFKFVAVFLSTSRRPDFRSSSGGILLAIAAALGFAGGENVLYLLTFGVERTLPRLILGNLGHAAFSVYWGYALGVVMHENASPSLIFAGLAAAALFHGLYDYLLTFSLFGALLAFFLSFGLHWLMVRIIRVERRRNMRRG